MNEDTAVLSLFSLAALGLVIAFMTLLIARVSGQIDWSWYWISLPIWIVPAGMILLILVIYIIMLGCLIKFIIESSISHVKQHIL